MSTRTSSDEQSAAKWRSSQEEKLKRIERTLRHAENTRRTETDSWLNGYQDDVRWLVERLRERLS